VEALRYE